MSGASHEHNPAHSMGLWRAGAQVETCQVCQEYLSARKEPALGGLPSGPQLAIARYSSVLRVTQA